MKIHYTTEKIVGRKELAWTLCGFLVTGANLVFGKNKATCKRCLRYRVED
jgi:hypothetical protein